MKLIEALGLDLRILFAQLVNFSILIFVLWRFAYKPVFKILEERKDKLAKGVVDSEEASLKLKEANEEKKLLVSGARKEAHVIIEEAKKKADERYQEIIDKSKEDMRIVVEEGKHKISLERNKAVLEIREETVKIVAAVLEKILPDKVGKKEDGELISRAIAELE